MLAALAPDPSIHCWSTVVILVKLLYTHIIIYVNMIWNASTLEKHSTHWHSRGITRWAGEGTNKHCCVLGVFAPVNLRCNLFRLTTKLENCSEDRLHMFFKQKQRAEEEQSCSDFSPLPRLPRLSSSPRPWTWQVWNYTSFSSLPPSLLLSWPPHTHIWQMVSGSTRGWIHVGQETRSIFRGLIFTGLCLYTSKTFLMSYENAFGPLCNVIQRFMRLFRLFPSKRHN